MRVYVFHGNDRRSLDGGLIEGGFSVELYYRVFLSQRSAVGLSVLSFGCHVLHMQVAVDMEFGRSMIEVRRRVRSTEVVVGWFSSTAYITEHSALIQEYYARETPAGVQPIHLSLDTNLAEDRPSMQAYVSIPMGTPGKVSGAMFCRVPCSIVSMNAEKVALHHLQQPRAAGDVQHIEASCKKMLVQLNSIVKYIDSVISGEVKGDENVGRFLLDLVNSVPRMDPHAMHTMLNGTTQDLLMMMYMATLAETPLTLMERIRTAHL